MTKPRSKNATTRKLLSYFSRVGVARKRHAQETVHQTVIHVREWQAEQRLWKALSGEGLIRLQDEGLLPNPRSIERNLMMRSKRLKRRGWVPLRDPIDAFGPKG